MVLASGDINIIADMEGTTGVKLHNNRQKLRNRFDIVRKLGQGTYGKVQLAVNKDTGEEVAIKTIRKSKIETEQDLVRIQREIQIMSSVQHPHIIHIYEVFENKEKIVLVMEYASGGELYDYLSYKKFLEEHEARRVFRQVVAAVYYCHKNMICHRDLKLENILLDEKGNAKIADFGLSNVFDDKNFLNTFCGSPLYASPEIVQGTPYYGPEVDCWSLGVLLYTLVYGAMPFDGSNFKRLVKQISEGDYYEPKELSDASSLIRKMLTVSPTKRATVDDISTDQWVDAGEDVSLASVSQEFCNQMPVRLDYLLALTAADDSQLSPVDETQIEGKIGPEPPSAPAENKTKPESQVESDIIDSEHVPNAIKDEKPLEPDVEAEKMESKDDNSDKLAAGEEPKLAESDNNVEECQQEEQLQEAPVDIPAEPTKEVADTGKETVTVKDKGVGVKRVSSFGKKVSLKTPLVKSKTSSEGVAPKLNGTASKIGKLKKSGSETEGADANKVGVERKPWVSAGAKSSSIKSPNPIPTSPTGKYSPTTKLTKTGSLDKPEVGPQSDVSKPPPRGTRVGSPVKQFHDSAHHKGCTPPDAIKVAQAEAKKSPPKSVVSKRPSQVPTREVSPKKFTAGAKPTPQQQQREKESPKRQVNGSRPRSPIKSVKPASDKAVKSPVTTPELEGGEHPLKSATNEKRGSIEIAPLKITRNYAESGADETTDQTQPQPQVSFTPKDKGGFTLLGVKSEVMFDVENPLKSPPPNPEPAVSVEDVEKVKSEDNDKVIKYVATVKKHGKDLTKPDDGPERVNILKLKCAPSDDDLGGQAVSASSDSIKEQRGYNVYRSKYRSIQKYRSVVEHQVGRVEDEAEVEEEEEEELSKRKEAEVEHCDSFSSAGSNDDLEDVFESLNSETMFSSLLSRTRHLIQRLSSGHIGISTNSSGGSSFSFNSPGISLLLTTNGQNQKSSATTANVSGSRRYGRSTSRSSQESEQSHRRYLDDTSPWERRSRYEDFLASSRVREDPQRELISSFLRNRNQSLDSTRRPRSYYGSATTGCLPGTRRSREDFSSTQDKDALDQFHHYSKSYSRQVSEESVESSSTHSSRLQHPRSYLAGTPNLNSGSSVHRDYSRSVSQTGGTSHAEEEETKQEHRVSEGKNQRSEVIKKECKRSVSHSESRVSSNKKDENLSRQDSGIESMFDVNSPTSAVADKCSSRPPPVKEEINEHPLAGRQQMKQDDDDDDSSIHVSDSGETGSVGSDSTSNDHWANSTSPSHISPSRSCGEESVGDRIRRKSFYARFNESRNPRNKARKQTTGLPTSVPSNAHLRHLLFDSDPFLESRNSHFDSLHQGDYYTHHRSPSQRWSMHLHSPTTGLPETDYFSPSSSFNIQSDASSTLPRRSSFTGATAGEDHGGAGPSMTRTHSLPEESNAPTDNASGSSLHSTGSLRRPRRLDLYDRSSLIGGPSLEDSLTSGRRSTWRHVPSTSSTSYRDPLESWDTPHYNRPNVGNALTSLMDSLESPSEVLQKAMELCDSLRKVK